MPPPRGGLNPPGWFDTHPLSPLGLTLPPGGVAFLFLTGVILARAAAEFFSVNRPCWGGTGRMVTSVIDSLILSEQQIDNPHMVATCDEVKGPEGGLSHAHVGWPSVIIVGPWSSAWAGSSGWVGGPNLVCKVLGCLD